MIYSINPATSPIIVMPITLGASISVGGSSDTAGASLDYYITLLDANANCVGDGGVNTLVCGTVLNWPLLPPGTTPTGYRGIAQLGGETALHPVGVNAVITVTRVSLKADGKTPTIWTVSAAVSYPVGVNNPQ